MANKGKAGRTGGGRVLAFFARRNQGTEIKGEKGTVQPGLAKKGEKGRESAGKVDRQGHEFLGGLLMICSEVKPQRVPEGREVRTKTNGQSAGKESASAALYWKVKVVRDPSQLRPWLPQGKGRLHISIYGGRRGGEQ